MSHLLSKRTGHVGCSIGGRRELHGEEPVPYMDIPYSVLITVAEAALITGDSHLADRWFDMHDGKLAERSLKDFKPYGLKGKFENSRATMWCGVNALEIKFPLVKFATLRFDPQKVGSMVELKFKIQSLITNKNNEIFLWMDRDTDIELQFGELLVKDTQEELDLEHPDAAPAAKAVGTPDEEREKARLREVAIATELSKGRGKPKRGGKAAEGATAH